MADCSRYAVGAVKNGQVHLTPLSAIVQMRPELSFLDQAEAASKARAKLIELEAGKFRLWRQQVRLSATDLFIK